jgi:molybdopterin molybdotransferase
MIPVERAREIILEHVGVLPAERVRLMDALGRYLAEDIVSPCDIPAFDNSAMDGYALCAEDVKRPGETLSVSYVLPAGAVRREKSQKARPQG